MKKILLFQVLLVLAYLLGPVTSVLPVLSNSNQALPQYLAASNDDTCQESWKEVLETGTSGNVISGSKAHLATALKHGARIRFQTFSGGYSGEADFCSRVNTHDVCCQALQHVSKQSWETFQTDSYWWFINICTTGHYTMTRYYVGGGHLSDTRTTGSFRWFVTEYGDDKFPCPIYSSLANGTAVSGSLGDLVNSALKGNSIRVSGEGRHVYPVNSVEVTKGSCLDSSTPAQVAVQNVYHVSQTGVGNHIEYQSNAYWWFATLCASGSRDMSRWTLGSHVSRGHTQDTLQMHWFEDSCWKQVYQIDAIGNTKGSLQALRQALDLGHRVKVRLGDHFIEVDNVRLTQGHVSAQIISFLGKKDICTFEDDLHWELKVVSSTGAVREYRPLVGQAPSQPLPGTPMNKKVTWFVDTREWKLLLHTRLNGSAISGTPQAVKDAINAGADIRVAIKLASDPDFRFFKADNLAFSPGSDVAAQLIRVLGEEDAGNDEFKLDPIPFWSFKIVNTKGDVRSTEWTLGAHTNRGRRTERAEVKWFAHV